MIGLDTNVLVRYIMQDDERQSLMASRLMESLTSEEPGFVSVVSVIELGWVLGGAYGLDRQQLAQAFEMGASGADLRGIVEMQVALQQARQAMDEKRFVNAGVHGAREHELMVLALRDAAEQRSLARDWASGRLTLAQLGSLEQVQAQAVAAVE